MMQLLEGNLVMGGDEPDAEAWFAQAVGAAARPDSEISEDVLYRSLLDAVPDVTVFAFGADLRYRMVSGGAFSRLGWTAADLVGRRPSEVMAAEDGYELEEHLH